MKLTTKPNHSKKYKNHLSDFKKMVEHDFYKNFLYYVLKNTSEKEGFVKRKEEVSTEIRAAFLYFFGLEISLDSGSEYKNLNTAYQTSVDTFLEYCTKKLKENNDLTNLDGYDVSQKTENVNIYTKILSSGEKVTRYADGGHLPNHGRFFIEKFIRGDQCVERRVQQIICNQSLDLSDEYGLVVRSDIKETDTLYALPKKWHSFITKVLYTPKFISQDKEKQEHQHIESAVHATRKTGHEQVVQMLSDFLVEKHNQKKSQNNTEEQ